MAGLILWIMWMGVISCARRDAVNEEPLSGVTGTLIHHEQLGSEFVEPRNIDVWLPPRYAVSTQTRYSVLYMHDGQNLFDPRSSFIGIDWGIDEVMTRLMEEERVRGAIVVGIWNTPKRVLEYMPQKPIEHMLAAVDQENSAWKEETPISDLYLKFIVFEVKPFIDSAYRTYPGRDHTCIMGSSMGALISIYALCEYPEIFGGAGCVSTHWPAADGVVIDYLRDALPDPATHTIYFDHGTKTIDAQYESYQKKMDEVMREAGYIKGVNWITRIFPGDEHSERAWKKRVHMPLTFLLGRND